MPAQIRPLTSAFLLPAAAAACALALPAAAQAEEPTGGTTPGSVPAAADALPPHALEGGRIVLLAGRTYTVSGTAPGADAGDEVRVGIAGPLDALDATVDAGAEGKFEVRVYVRGPGAVKVTGRTGRAARATALSGTAIRAAAKPGDAGLHVQFLTEGLRRLGYSVGVGSRFGPSTGSAVMAFRKVSEMSRVVTASSQVFSALADGRGAYRVRFPGSGRHVEGDLTHQVLALVGSDGRPTVYNTSTGKPGFRTPVGAFRFWRQELGENPRGMVNSSFFSFTKSRRGRRGYRPACAIHGYYVVPPIPASHCCFRVANADSRPIRLWVRIGDSMRIYGRQNGLPG